MYPSRLQDQFNALRMLKNRHDHHTQVKTQPVYKSDAAAVYALFILEQNLYSYKQTLVASKSP